MMKAETDFRSVSAETTTLSSDGKKSRKKLSLSFLEGWAVDEKSESSESVSFDSWGPPPLKEPMFSDLPFAPFSKRDAVNYVSDWYSTRPVSSSRKRVGDDEAVLQFDKVEDDFESVNVAKYEAQKAKAAAKKSSKSWFTDTSKQIGKVSQAHDKAKKGERAQWERSMLRNTSKKKARLYKAKRRIQENLRPNVHSIRRDEQWTQLEDLQLYTMVFDRKKPPTDGTTLFTAGTLHQIVNSLDRVSCTRPITVNTSKYGSWLNGCPFAHFDWTSASQDPYMVQTLASAGTAHVYTTDTALSVLMDLERSRYSFDVVVTKVKGSLWVEARPLSRSVSFQSVDETSPHRPTTKGATKENTWDALAEEANGVRYALAEQLTAHSPKGSRACDETHPFKDDPILSAEAEGRYLASAAFVYRRFTTADGTVFVVRCTVEGIDASTKKWTKILAMFQYNALLSKSINWHRELDRKEAAVFLEEMRHNSFWVSRRISAAILAGIDQMKVGFVTRKHEAVRVAGRKARYEIVGVKTYAVKEMARQTQLEPWRQWGQVAFLCDLFRQVSDGRYILVREPVKHNIRVFSIPDSSFEKGDGIQQCLGSLSMLQANVKRPTTLPRYFT